jgi:hypothetical protein
MGNVVQFPSNTVAADALRNHLVQKIDELDALYEVLDALHLKLHELEQHCSKLEYSFDTALSRYADKVGSENVEVQFLGYTSRHIVSIDADGQNFTLTIAEDILNED